MTQENYRGFSIIDSTHSEYDFMTTCQDFFGESVEAIKQNIDRVLKIEKAMEVSTNDTLIHYKGFVIVDSDKIEGWFMTKCKTIFGEDVTEVKDDIDRANKADKDLEHRMLFI